MASSNPNLRSQPEPIGTVGEQLKGKITEFSSAAAEKLEQSRGPAAAGLEHAAESLRGQADHRPSGDAVAKLAYSAADTLTETAEYVRDFDLNRMAADVEYMVREYPGAALACAAGIGFLTGRAFSGSRRG